MIQSNAIKIFVAVAKRIVCIKYVDFMYIQV